MLHIPTLQFVGNSPLKIGVEDEEVVVAKKLSSLLEVHDLEQHCPHQN